MSKKGLTIIELIVTMGIFFVVSLSFLSFFMFNQRTNVKLNRRARMIETLNNRIEEFKIIVGNTSNLYVDYWNAPVGACVDTFIDILPNDTLRTLFYVDSSYGSSPGVSPSNIFMHAVITGKDDTLIQPFIVTLKK